jgi:threonine dehydratase
MTFALVQELASEVVVVREDELRAAIRGMAAEEHLIVEGAAAVAVAAAGRAARTGPVVAVVTGANIDGEVLAGVLSA